MYYLSMEYFKTLKYIYFQTLEILNLVDTLGGGGAGTTMFIPSPAAATATPHQQQQQVFLTLI